MGAKCFLRFVDLLTDALGRRCCLSLAVAAGLLSAAVPGLLIAAASLAADQGLQSACGSWA